MYRGTLDAASNREDFQRTFQVIDGDTSQSVNLAAASIVFAVREPSDDQQVNAPSYPTPILTASIANGKITIVDVGTFQVWFTLADMETLCAAYYDVGCTVTINGVTSQMMIAELPVVDGVVSA